MLLKPVVQLYCYATSFLYIRSRSLECPILLHTTIYVCHSDFYVYKSHISLNVSCHHKGRCPHSIRCPLCFTAGFVIL